MSIAFQQRISDFTGSAPIVSGAFTPNAAGDALFVAAINTSSNNTQSFSGASSYTVLETSINPGTAVGASVSCVGGSQTMTADATGGGTLHCFPIEYSGVGSATSPAAQFLVNPGTGSGAILGTSQLVPSGSVLAALCFNFDTGTNTISSPSGTNRGNGLSGDNFEYCWTEYAGAGANIQPSFTSADGGTQRFVVFQILMTPGTAPSAGPNPLFRMALPFAPLAWIIRRRQILERKRNADLRSWKRDDTSSLILPY